MTALGTETIAIMAALAVLDVANNMLPGTEALLSGNAKVGAGAKALGL